MPSAMRPRRSYFVCTTPRSGSTLFCEGLAATGIAGRPAEPFEALRGTDLPRQPQEYFGERLTPGIEALLPRSEQQPAPELAAAGTYRDYLAWAVPRGTTPNGVFGSKLMWGYFGEFVQRLRELDGDDSPPLTVLERWFGDVRFVRVMRPDKIGQAVSLWKAIQTQAWRAGGPARAAAEPVFHFGAIHHLIGHLSEHERRWTQLFSDAGLEPLLITYDQVVGDWDGTLRRTLAHLGVDADIALPAPALDRQADARSRDWVQRYLVERERQAATAEA